MQIAQGALAALQDGNVHLKFRTGGLEARLFPTPQELAEVIAESVRRQVSFKLTAGLHRAVRHTDPATGFTHHGFLNIALATDAAAQGAGPERSQGDPGKRRPDRDWPLTLWTLATSSWRQWFHSFGTCSIAEPLESLAAMGLSPESFTVPDAAPADISHP